LGSLIGGVSEGLDLGLADKHLLVTGAGGLGRVLVGLALDAGMRVSVVDRDPESLAALPAAQGLAAIPFDLTDVAGHQELLANCVGNFGPLHCFVPTAAVIRRQHDLAEITEDDWDTQASVNQKSVYFLTRSVAERMKSSGGGAIVLVASAAGVTGGIAGTTVYASTKAGVLATMHGFARIYASAGLRINAVVPGTMDTPMLWVGQKPEAVATIDSLCGMGRVGQPVEIARPILFLLSDWASFITGHSLDVDGGWLYR
jgi:NAD(P)-dependent dehydrogenase (short-subunit alcohol dehydrogenase family)